MKRPPATLHLQAQPWQHTANQVELSTILDTAVSHRFGSHCRGYTSLSTASVMAHINVTIATGQQVLSQQHATAPHEGTVERNGNVTWLRVQQRSRRH